MTEKPRLPQNADPLDLTDRLLANRPEALAEIYRENAYLDAYIAHTELRARKDPRAAIGGMWDEIGPLQLDFLTRQGLLPTHRFLDIGCGALRGGIHLIRYLARGNYTGLDISPSLIAFSKTLVSDEGLDDKAPRLELSRHNDLKFTQFSGDTFDYLLAQSVFTHLLPEHIEECFAHIRTVMSDEAQFYFTYHQADTATRTGLKGFSYPQSFFQGLATEHGFVLRDCSADYPHPRDQKMLELTKGAG